MAFARQMINSISAFFADAIEIYGPNWQQVNTLSNNGCVHPGNYAVHETVCHPMTSCLHPPNGEGNVFIYVGFRLPKYWILASMFGLGICGWIWHSVCRCAILTKIHEPFEQSSPYLTHILVATPFVGYDWRRQRYKKKSNFLPSYR